jgi:uncharacterized protein (DUF58 family)
VTSVTSPVEETVDPVPLIPRRRMIGSMLGAYTSVRRGEGADIAGSRPYRPGDPSRLIDWKASARLSATTGGDEFIVRERYAHEMPRVVLIVDRRPAMSLYPEDSPWLAKAAAVRNVVDLIVVSAVNQRGLVGYLDFGSHEGNDAGAPYWRPPRAQAGFWQGNLLESMHQNLAGGFDAPADGLDRSLSFLSVLPGTVPTGSFVFVVSDFLEPPSPTAWSAAIDRGWDVVAVVVQDPVWEQSFPPIGGVVAPFVEPQGPRLQYVRLSQREAAERSEANRERLRAIERDVTRLGLDMILVSDSDPAVIRQSFLEWAELRLTTRGTSR